MKRLEFSKIILLGISFVFLFIILFSTVMIWKTNDLSPLSYLITSIAAIVSAATGFYFNKAKAENKIKLMKENNIQLENDDFDE